MTYKESKKIINSLDVIQEIIISLELHSYEFNIVKHAALINWRQQYPDFYSKLKNIDSAIRFNNHKLIQIKGEDLLHSNNIKRLATRKEPLLSLASLVRSSEGTAYHLPMMNLHLDYTISIDLLKKALNQLVDKPYYLMSTDRYYHVYGNKRLLTEEEWKKWNLNFLMLDAIVSPRYIGHSLERGFNLLRFNATDAIKTTVPHLVMVLNSEEDLKLQELRKFAIIKHGPQVTKSGELYFRHLFEVEKIATQIAHELGFLESEIFLIRQAAILHDSIEDTDTDYEDIIEISDRKVADVVALLSNDKRKPKSERDEDFLKQIERAPLLVQLIKLADIYANLSSIYQNLKKGREVNNNYLLKADSFLSSLDQQLHSTTTFKNGRAIIDQIVFKG